MKLICSTGVQLRYSEFLTCIREKNLRKQQEPEQQRSAYLLGWRIYIHLFIYNNFNCNNQYKKAAIREELNPHVR